MLYGNELKRHNLNFGLEKNSYKPESTQDENDPIKITTVKFCGLGPVQLSNNLGAGPLKKISIEIPCFLNKNILSFLRQMTLTLFNTIFDPLIELKSVISEKIFPPRSGSRLNIYFNQQRFLQVCPYPYQVQLPNYLAT
jgi:hypothetical protein